VPALQEGKVTGEAFAVIYIVALVLVVFAESSRRKR